MDKAKFSGHQTFSPRYGWIEKGYDFAQSGGSFSAPDALVRLGVGKNMVSSIEYWSKMTGILDDQGKPTVFASLLLAENGYDPYLEDDASWWLLHWNLVAKNPFLTSGSFLFSFLRKAEFSKGELKTLILRKQEENQIKSISLTTIERDVDCYLRCYVSRPAKKGNLDGTFDCPFQDLHLIEYIASDSERFFFNIGEKCNLHPYIVGYALWDMLQRTNQQTALEMITPTTREGILLKDAVYGNYSPGQAFMLDEKSFGESIFELHTDRQFGKFFSISESAGVVRVHCSLKDGIELLDAYYRA